jgi:hypothetical protein
MDGGIFDKSPSRAQNKVTIDDFSNQFVRCSI